MLGIGSFNPQVAAVVFVAGCVAFLVGLAFQVRRGLATFAKKLPVPDLGEGLARHRR